MNGARAEAALSEALAELSPARLVAERVPKLDRIPERIVALGKCSESMTGGALDALGKGTPSREAILVVSPHGGPDPRWRAFAGDHPVPGATSFVAGRELRRFLDVDRHASLLALISGGGSALAELPRPPATESDLALLGGSLLRAGWPIATMNRVRAAVSDLKQGGLLRDRTGHVTTFVFSDVGRDPAVVASGPTIPSESSDDVAPLLGELALPSDVHERLFHASALGGATHAPGDVHLLASPESLADAMARRLPARIVDPNFDGTADRLASLLAELPAGSPAVVVGEPTLALPPDAPPGGRAAHVALDVALRRLSRAIPTSLVFAAASDGVDGTGGGSGARLGPEELDRLNARRSEAVRRLAKFDATRFLDELGALRVRTETGTNLRDVYVLA